MATVLLALEHNEPLDEILFTEVMFDHARNISGEIPEHIINQVKQKTDRTTAVTARCAYIPIWEANAN